MPSQNNNPIFIFYLTFLLYESNILTRVYNCIHNINFNLLTFVTFKIFNNFRKICQFINKH